MSNPNEPDCSDIRQLLEQGRGFFTQGQADRALAAVSEARRRAAGRLPPEHPLYFSAVVNALDLYLGDENYSTAERLALDYLKLVPQDTPAAKAMRAKIRNILANLYVRAGRMELAERLLLEAAREPADGADAFNAYYLLALIYALSGRADEGRALLAKLEEIAGQVPVGHLDEGHIRKMLADTRERLRPAADSGDDEPRADDPTFLRGEAECWGHFVAWDFRRAAADALRLLVQRSTERLIAVRLVSCLWLGESVARDVEKVRRVAPPESWARAFADFALGAAPFQEVLDRARDDEDRASAYFYAGLCALHARDEAAALDRFRRAAEPGADTPEADQARNELESVLHLSRDPSALSDDQRRRLGEAHAAFHRHDYGAFASAANELAQERAGTPQLVLLQIAAFRALGADSLVTSLARLARREAVRRPWHARLIDVVVGEVSALALEAEAADPVRACQLHYYAAAAARVAGHWEEAEVHRLAARRVPAACPEYDLTGMDAPDPNVVLENVVDQLSALLRHGRVESAEVVGRAALAYARRAGAGPVPVARLMSALGVALAERGSVGEALALYDELAALPDVPADDRFAFALNAGQLYMNLGVHSVASRFLYEALELSRSVEPGPCDRATLYNAVGMITSATGRAEDALGWYAMAEEALGDREPDLLRAALDDNTATSLADAGRFPDALARMERARATLADLAAKRDGGIPANYPSRQKNLTNLAWLLMREGQLGRAEPLAAEAAAMCGDGDRDPTASSTLLVHGIILAAAGKRDEALAALLRGAELGEPELGERMTLGAEHLRMTYGSLARLHLGLVLFLAAGAPAADGRVLERVFTLVLRRKALAAEVALAQRAALRSGRYPLLESAHAELESLRAEVATRTLAALRGSGPLPDGGARLREAERRVGQLEAQLAKEVPESRLDHLWKDVTAAAVADTLSRHWALVEYVRCPAARIGPDELSGVTPMGERYFAFVLPSADLGRLTLTDLGPAAAIDAAVAEFRASVAGAGRARDLRPDPDPAPAGSPDGPARTLRELLFDPLAAHLPPDGHVAVAPDGAVVRVPLEALPTGENTYLTDRYSFSYVGTSRDLLRLAVAPSGTPGADVVVADPDFGRADGAGEGRAARFGDLPGTRREGEAVAGLLGVSPSLRADSSEALLKRLSSPRVLHLATHGYFDEGAGAEPAPAGGLLRAVLRPPAETADVNPLLRTGLALAGANRAAGEADDGLLSAAEVLSLRLARTELVVLSACDTGLGPVHQTEGVLGLRRAFQLAGARCVIVSLWKVPDEQTCELMVGFYRRLLRGVGRAEALRAAQLECRASHPSPYYWAAFVCYGDTGPLFGLAPAWSRVTGGRSAPGAVEALTRAIEREPLSADHRVSRGIAYHNLGRFTDAVADFDRAAQLAPRSPLIYYSRGFAYHLLGRLDAALADFDRAIEIDPDYAPAYHRRGNSRGALGQFEPAYADLTRAVTLDRKDAQAWYDRAGLAADHDMPREAGDDYARAIAIEPSFQHAYVNRATVLMQSGDIAAATDDLRKAIELDPGDAVAHLNLAHAYQLGGDTARALASVDRAAALGSPDVIRLAQRLRAHIIGTSPPDEK